MFRICNGVVDYSWDAFKEDNVPYFGLDIIVYTSDISLWPLREISGYKVYPYGEGVDTVEHVSDKYAIIDFATGKLLTDFIYDDYCPCGFVEGILPVKKTVNWDISTRSASQ